MSCLNSRNVLTENVLEPRVVDDYLLIYSLLIHLNATQNITKITGQPRNKTNTNSSTKTSENLISMNSELADQAWLNAHGYSRCYCLSDLSNCQLVIIWWFVRCIELFKFIQNFSSEKKSWHTTASATRYLLLRYQLVSLSLLTFPSLFQCEWK